MVESAVKNEGKIVAFIVNTGKESIGVVSLPVFFVSLNKW